MDRIHLEIVTVERLVFSDDVDMLVAPTTTGQITVLPQHAPLLTMIEPGEIRIMKGGEESYIAVSRGFLEVIGNKATILADTAERAEEIDIERAQAALQHARELIALSTLKHVSSADMERELMEARKFEMRLKVARRKKRQIT